MENISYVGLSHQMALRQQMELVSNNVANMTTPGFKAQEMLFVDFLARPKGGENLSQVLDQSSFRRMEQGPMSQTFNQLDLAISGNAYFSVETPIGPRYTRAGNFALNANREIVNPDGLPLLSDANNPLQIPEGDNQIFIDAEGIVTTENNDVGRIKLVSFPNDQDLEELGGGLYRTDPNDEIAAEDAQVVQGAIEGSNVQPVVEMTKMIEILRTYQSVSRMMQNDHDRQRSAIRTLSRQSA